MIALFGISYFLLLVPRAPWGLEFDRYVLPLMPVVTILLLLRFQFNIPNRVSPRWIAPAAYCLLGVYALYGLMLTQDVLALGRARAEALSILERHGVPPSAVAAGLEFDAWEQVNLAGYINLAEIRIPPHAYNPNVGAFPALRCRYRLEFPRQRDTVASEFGSIAYVSWLPPFHRMIYIDEFRNPWWLNPNRPAGSWQPRSFETYTFE